MANSIIFDPLLPWSILASVSAVMVIALCFALWRGLAGWPLRGCAVLILTGALSNPSWQQEEREALSDIVLLVVDSTASQGIGERREQSAAALERMKERIEARADTELRVATLLDGERDTGSLLMAALSEALADIPSDRLAGVFLLTDGQIHDAELAPDLPAPLHALLSGRATDWDRRLVVKNAPAFAILGEQLTLTLRIEDQGAVPLGIRQTADLHISIDGQDPQVFEIPIGENLDLPLTLPHGGMNTLQFSTPEMPEELTDRNNAAIVQINGVRDRLRVLLVSGEPHPGERTWRNLLKSDSSVDLVHFTILRPPEKQDGVPVNELSLIAFPTRELFLEKIDEFDLIIFDRYKRRGILPEIYLENVRRYVERGGAVLVAAGVDFASADSLYHSPLAQILPARPTARVIEEGFTPQISLTGQRHPVTEGLETFAPERENVEPGTGPGWGRWFRLVELQPSESGQTVMTGTEDKPLLVLDRVGEGRVALLASDQSWLWTRGYEGGGPQLELLRRLAHWMMKEPELEEEALWAEARGQSMTVIRRTLEDSAADVEITTPGGELVTVPMAQTAPGRYQADFDGPEIGLYRLSDGTKDAVIALGPAAPREFVQTIATGDVLAPVVDETRGGVVKLEEGLPGLRNVRWGRPAAGRGWVGLTPRGAYLTTDVTVHPLLPAWLSLLLAAAFMLGAWLREGRR
ncbi:hypothetical protein ACFFUT_03230 [Pseudohalocynthiibacter aestuariivivens]|uniref:Glutamine amidotransferase domain-containing protein n=1 Tax=Pseudohalocynthiibacter aestuariivivens TaxID=1591409 RepID=A0ABV5JBG9_9RHOB|nr:MULTISPECIES: hypothetical protein [Pseudohalocynthiibacter]MBS9715643.1 hypothetical protein [Pseudohalocynthiibacter aestuariivivens]MCK0101256.1 hypothetical protein [Pseudohalocynthiibacter sp. F2068]